MSDKQSKEERGARHRWFELMSNALNNSGETQTVLIPKLDMQVSWTKESLKDIYRQIGFQMFGKESSEDLTGPERHQVQIELEEMIVRCTRSGIFVDFPHIEMPLEVYENEIIRNG